MSIYIDINYYSNSECNFKEKNIFINSFIGRFSLKSEFFESNAIAEIYKEAQQKYSRMHSAIPSTRFEKSLTGFIGESIISSLIMNKLNLKLDDRKVLIDENGYDGGDIHFYVNGNKQIANVSSRKLSMSDEIKNVVLEPDKYFVLIPTDQFNQYTMRANIAFFVFIKYDSNKVRKNFDNTTIEILTEGDFIVPGYLKAKDIISLREKKYIVEAKKGENINGLYSDMNFNVPMYTNNIVLFSNLLRKFKIK